VHLAVGKSPLQVSLPAAVSPTTPNPLTRMTTSRRQATPARMALRRALSSRLLLCALTQSAPWAGIVALAPMLSTTIYAQENAGTGTIEGRVQNVATGASLENARVSVKGTNTVAFTDFSGRYQLNNLPAGTVVLRFFYTGLDEQEVNVTVESGKTIEQNISLRDKSRFGDTSDIVQLDPYTVQASKESSAAAIAVNEQRFAKNMVSVVAADEFGTMIDNNPGELLKNLPGMDVEYFGGTIVAVSVRGLGAENTAMTFDGMPSASANVQGSNSGENPTRAFEVQNMSASDVSRVEVRKVPLPEDSANSVGGSINFVRRSAFEKSKREIKYTASLVSDGDHLTTRKLDGPKDELNNRWRPNWSVTWTEPVIKNVFGFSVTVGQTDLINNVRWSSGTWNIGSFANFTAHRNLIAAGQPLTSVPSIFNPALDVIALSNAPYSRGNDNASVRLDWRPRRELTLGWSLAYTDAYKGEIEETRFRIGTGGIFSNTPTETLGSAGQGYVRSESAKWRDHEAPQLSSVFSSEWKKNSLTLGARFSYAQAQHKYKDTENGFFEQTSAYGTNDGGLVGINHMGFGTGTARLTNATTGTAAQLADRLPITVDFYDPGYYITAGRIDIRTTPTRTFSTNRADYTVPVDWRDPSLWRIGGATSRPGKAKNIVTAGQLTAEYQFDTYNPLSLKAGLYKQEYFLKREYLFKQWRYVGADGVPNTADDTAAPIVYSSAGPRDDPDYGHVTPPRFSMSKLYQLYLNQPSWFVFDAERTQANSLRTGRAFEITEGTTAGYLQGNWRLFNNRLQLTGGVRYEKQEAEGRALLTNRRKAYLKYADGSTVRLNDRDAANAPMVINTGTASAVNYQLVNAPTVIPTVRAGAPIFNRDIQLAGNALNAAGRSTSTNTNVGLGTELYTNTVYKRLGAVGEGSIDGYYPSLHATFNVTENIDVQLAFAKTTTRPDLASTVIPTDDISDDLVTVNGVPALGRITINNPDLQPMDSKTYDMRVTYYTKNGGSWSFGLYRKNFKNFSAQIDTEPLTEQDLAELQERFPEKDFGSDLVGYTLRTRENMGTSRLDGAEFEGRQTLDPLLPSWAHGFRIGGSIAYANRKGANQGNLGRNRAWRGAANLNYTARRFSAAIKYQMNGDWIENDSLTNGAYYQTSTGDGVIGKQVILRQDVIDLEASYRIYKWAEVFVSAGNVTNEFRVREQQVPGRPSVGSMTSSSSLGKFYAVGVKGTF
jgi:iron complex outermembrane recepter protein